MKKVEEERLRRLKEEEESLRTIKEEQDRLKRIKEEEARFKRIEQDRLKRIKEEEERLKRIKEEQERLKRTKEEEDRQRKVKEEEDRLRRIKEEEERQRRVKEEEYRLKRIKEEEENQRKIKEEELLRRKDQERLLRRRKEQGRQQQRRRKEQAEELRRQKEQELEQEIRRKEQEEALKKQKELEEELERQKKGTRRGTQEAKRVGRSKKERKKGGRKTRQEEEIRRRKNQELRRRTEIELQKRRHEQERIRKEPDEDLKLSKEEHEREKIIREHERRKKFDRKRLTNLEKERQRYVDQQQQLLKKERRQFEVNRRRKLRRERYKGIKAERRIQIEPTNEPVPSTRSKESTQASIGRKRIVVIDRDEPIGTRQNVQNIDSRRRFYLNEGNTAIRRKKVNLEGERLAPKIIKSVEMSTSVKSTVREEVRQVKEIRHVSKVITISPHHSISHSHSEKSNEPIPKQPMKEVTPVKLPNTENDETRRECVITQPSNGNITCNGITPLDTIPPNEQCTLTCASGFVSLEKDEAKCYHGRLTQQLECVKPDALLVIGGRSDTYGVLSSVELITAQGVCRGAVPPLPQMRWKLIVIAIGRDSVLACGGAGQYGDSKGDCWLMEFNPSPKWKETQSMKLPRDSAAVAYESNKVYVLGGSLGKLNGYTDVIDVYDPQTEKWGNKGFHMTSPRHSHCAVGLGNGSIFVTGGYGGLSLAERFDIADNKWTALPELNPVRAQHGCALVDLHGEQGVIIVGGDSGGTRLGDVRFLSLKTSVWSKVAELNTARWGRPGVGVVGGRITVSAGWSGFRDLDTVEYYNEKTSAWRLTASRLQTERRWPYSTPISLSLFPKCIQKRSSG
ncbi:KLHL2_3 [Lepeophtheirus salmonis]|uniref:KLHL2_3 n=1 Tax=Lepeophtheirus salmonis TaxID=72036 RepID=A0A7R8CSL1_LEPSM|nr:KLHL2_3 [Lepeophtheirus salmonis]CAF2917985.1 KLHL2_3 [Lepeophtheirus salmonis]